MGCVLDVIFMLTLCLMLQGGVFVGLMTLVLMMVEVEVEVRIIGIEDYWYRDGEMSFGFKF